MKSNQKQNNKKQSCGPTKFNYKLFCSGENPEDLVMLRNPDEMTQTIFENAQPIYIWICEHQPETTNVRKRVFKELQTKIHTFKLASECSNFVQGNQLVLISSNISDAQALKRKTSILSFIFYPESTFPIKNQSLLKLEFPYELVFNEVQLFNQIKKLVKKQFRFKELPTFISTRDQTWNSRIVVQTMFAMLNQKITNQGRKIIVDQLSILFKQIIDQSTYFEQFKGQIKSFIAELKQGNLITKRALYWHTLESPVYKLINNLLRVSRHPSETFYIQPYFKDVFNAISFLHKQQRQEGDYLVFTCYRGGLASKEQLEYLENNIGQIIQNLGFLSTSNNEQEALNYTKNIFFEISIHCSQEINDFGHGYAQISRFSQYFSEEEILFNPLNYFKLVEIGDTDLNGKRIKKIKLLGGDEVNRLFCISDKHQTKEQQRLKAKLISQRKTDLQNINQGNVLIENSQCLAGAVQYWQKYTSMIKQDSIQRVRAYCNMEFCYSWFGHFDKALQTLAQCQQFLKANQPNPETLSIANSVQCRYFNIYILKQNYSKALELYTLFQKQDQLSSNIEYKFGYMIKVARIYLLLYNKTKCLQILQEIKQFLLKYDNIHSIKYAECLKEMANVYSHMKNYEKSLELFQQNKVITLNVEGEQSTMYVNIIIKQALNLCALGKFKESINFCEKALKLLSQIEQSMPAGCGLYKMISRVYLWTGQQRKALQMMFRQLKMIEKQQGQNNEQYIMTLYFISQIYQSLIEKQKAFEIFKKIDKLMQSRTNHNILPSILVLMAKICISNHQFERALKYLQKSRLQLESQNKIQLFQYAHVLMIQSRLMIKIGNYNKSVSCYEIGSKIRKNLGVMDQQDFLIDQAQVHERIGQFQKAIDYVNQVEALSKYNSAKAFCICLKLQIYQNIGYHPQQHKFVQKSYEQFLWSEDGSLNYYYTILIMEKGILFYHFNQYKKALKAFEKWKFLSSILKSQIQAKQKYHYNAIKVIQHKSKIKLKNTKKKMKLLNQMSYCDF